MPEGGGGRGIKNKEKNEVKYQTIGFLVHVRYIIWMNDNIFIPNREVVVHTL